MTEIDRLMDRRIDRVKALATRLYSRVATDAPDMDRVDEALTELEALVGAAVEWTEAPGEAQEEEDAAVARHEAMMADRPDWEWAPREWGGR